LTSSKPLSLEELSSSFATPFSSAARRRNQSLRSELGHRYQVSAKDSHEALRQQIAVTAPTNGRVLIFGEAATARSSSHAHFMQPPPQQGPFVEVNCAAIPKNS